MDLKLAENIKAFRKERRLTQEQLAEVLGVTTGAVYKWESGLSLPELGLIVEMADFFDTSVDVLLGYQLRDNRFESLNERIGEYCRSMNPEALNEADKLLRKFPNSFEVVYSCAEIYQIFGVGKQNRQRTRRALELLEQALRLIGQNKNPEISEQSIYYKIGAAHMNLGEAEKAIDILKRHNTESIYSDEIGVVLSVILGRADEAEPYLTEGLLQGMNTLLNSIVGICFVFHARGQYDRAREILEWGLMLLNGVRNQELSGYTEKIQAVLLTLMACLQRRTGQPEEARKNLEKAIRLVKHFDEKPDYGMQDLRFIDPSKRYSIHDMLGVTAEESVRMVLRLIKEPEMEALWKEAWDND